MQGMVISNFFGAKMVHSLNWFLNNNWPGSGTFESSSKGTFLEWVELTWSGDGVGSWVGAWQLNKINNDLWNSATSLLVHTPIPLCSVTSGSSGMMSSIVRSGVWPRNWLITSHGLDVITHELIFIIISPVRTWSSCCPLGSCCFVTLPLPIVCHQLSAIADIPRKWPSDWSERGEKRGELRN